MNQSHNQKMMGILLMIATFAMNGCQQTTTTVSRESHPTKLEVNRAGDVVELQGTVYPEKYFGPPGYGENPQTDQQEVAYILQLNPPRVFVTATADALRVHEIQLINYDRGVVGKPITIKGQLDQAISGHHRRTVILVVQSESKE